MKVNVNTYTCTLIMHMCVHTTHKTQNTHTHWYFNKSIFHYPNKNTVPGTRWYQIWLQQPNKGLILRTEWWMSRSLQCKWFLRLHEARRKGKTLVLLWIYTACRTEFMYWISIMYSYYMVLKLLQEKNGNLLFCFAYHTHT